MSEQATMTRPELEKAGYRFYEAIDDVYNRYAEVFFDTPDGYESPRYEGEPDSMTQLWEQATQAATAHYRQQQELAALREFKRLVEVAAQKEPPTDDPDIFNALFAVRVWQAYDKAFKEGVLGLPTVSESERAE